MPVITSSRFTLDRNDAVHILKVLGYSCLSAALVAVAALLAHIKVAAEYAFLVPLANSLIVSGERFFQEKQAEEQAQIGAGSDEQQA